MKTITYHWVEMRTVEVPDNCPDEDGWQLKSWLYDHPKDYTLLKSDTRDFEIVDIDKEK